MDPHLSGWHQRAPHQLAVFPTSENGTYLGEGRTTQCLPGLTPLTLVTCVKCTMTIIALNRGRILSASEKATPLFILPFHLAQASPLHPEFPTWIRGLFRWPPLGPRNLGSILHWREEVEAGVFPALSSPSPVPDIRGPPQTPSKEFNCRPHSPQLVTQPLLSPPSRDCPKLPSTRTHPLA